MGFKSKESEIKNLLGKHILVSYYISKKAKQGVATTTGCIPESLQRHNLPEGRIKKIDDTCYEMFHFCLRKTTN